MMIDYDDDGIIIIYNNNKSNYNAKQQLNYDCNKCDNNYQSSLQSQRDEAYYFFLNDRSVLGTIIIRTQFEVVIVVVKPAAVV